MPLSSSIKIDDAVVVLVVGACGLDRQLMVPHYPSPDSKVRTTEYHEVGGGNAANTAAVVGLLSNASFLRHISNYSGRSVAVKLCSKVGDDHVGKQLVEELEESGVDLSSPLFKIGNKGSTTGVTSIIVSASDHTRTCLHTPGTCGELTAQDVMSTDLELVFQNVVHLHCDGRHTEAALALAVAARNRNITVSVDVEKDRKTKALDALMEVATTVFTNADQIEDYLSRLTTELELENCRNSLEEVEVVAREDVLSAIGDSFAESVAISIRPSAFFSRWYRQEEKEVVITKGSRGAIRVGCCGTKEQTLGDTAFRSAVRNQIVVDRKESDVFYVQHTFLDRSTIDERDLKLISSDYAVLRVGVLDEITVIDTTGSGDAFMGAYILCKLTCGDIATCLRFGSWVAGRKVTGPGARMALPTADEVDEDLGKTIDSIRQLLKLKITPFKQYS